MLLSFFVSIFYILLICFPDMYSCLYNLFVSIKMLKVILLLSFKTLFADQTMVMPLGCLSDCNLQLYLFNSQCFND